MVAIKSKDGAEFRVSAGAVAAILDREPDGKMVTCVFGVVKAYIRVDGTPDAFMATIGMTDGFAKLTRVDGTPVWVNKESASLKSSLPTSANKGGCIVVTSAFATEVKESLDDAAAAINKGRKSPPLFRDALW